MPSQSLLRRTKKRILNLLISQRPTPSLLSLAPTSAIRLFFNVFIGITLYTTCYLTYENITLSNEVYTQKQLLQEFENSKEELQKISDSQILTLRAHTVGISGGWKERFITLSKTYGVAAQRILKSSIKNSEPNRLLALSADLSNILEEKIIEQLKASTKIQNKDLEEYIFQKNIFTQSLIESLKAQLTPLDVYLSYLRGHIEHLDEHLTMSAINASLTGDLKWEKVYLENELLLNLALNQVRRLAPNALSYQGYEKTNRANDKLVRLEKLALRATREGDLIKARKYLANPEYAENKLVYIWGMDMIKKTLIERSSTLRIDHHKRIEKKIFYFALISFGLFLGWAMVTLIVGETRKARDKTFHNAKLISIGELAAGIGHEINNPLTILKSRIDELEDLETSLPNQSLKIISKSQRNAAQRIEEIVKGLRTYARSNTTEKVRFKANEIILNSINMISKIYENDQIKLITQLDAPYDVILGTPGRFQQVFLNLLSNAKDALTNTLNKTIIVKSYNLNNEFLLEIVDNGAGIPKSIQKKVFKSFFTTKQVGQGVGLGLAISQSAIADMRGQLTFRSTLKKGTSFRISLPLVQLDQLASDDRASHEDLKAISNLKSKQLFAGNRTALVVDDEPELREILSEYLEGFGLIVDCAENGKLAFEKVQLQTYDFVFSDIKMPEMLGNEFVNKAKKIDDGHTQYFLMSGGMPNFDDAESARPYDSPVIYKPFNRQTIYQTLIEFSPSRDLSS